MDRIVFDIETKNSFADVGGQQNLRALDASVVGVYSYANNTYRCFEEHEFPELGDILKRTHLLIGFSSKRFDVPVMEKYFSFNLAAVPHMDILEEIEKTLGRRIGLGVLAEANINAGKTGHGMEAIDLYRQGEIEKLKAYCLQDVKLTKEIYDLICARQYLWIPERNTTTMKKLMLSYKEEVSAQTGFL